MNVDIEESKPVTHADSSADAQRLLELAQAVFGPSVWAGERPSRPLASVELVGFLIKIERSFGIQVPDHELNPENFESLRSILALIQRSRS